MFENDLAMQLRNDIILLEYSGVRTRKVNLYRD